MNRVEFFVPGLPKGAGSKNAFPLKKWIRRLCPHCGWEWDVKDFYGRVGVEDSSGPAGKEWRATINAGAFFAMQKAGIKPLEGPLFASFDFVLPRPKYHFNSKGQLKSPWPTWHEKKPDLLKLGRAAEDAMKGVVYVDDSQISLERLKKSYATGAEGVGCLITVEELGSQPGDVSIVVPPAHS